MKARRKDAKHNFYYKDESRELSLSSDEPGYFEACLTKILEADLIPPMEEQITFSSSLLPAGAPEFGHGADEETPVRVPGYAGDPPSDVSYLKTPRTPGEGLPDPLDFDD